MPGFGLLQHVHALHDRLLMEHYVLTAVQTYSYKYVFTSGFHTVAYSSGEYLESSCTHHACRGAENVHA